MAGGTPIAHTELLLSEAIVMPIVRIRSEFAARAEAATLVTEHGRNAFYEALRAWRRGCADGGRFWAAVTRHICSPGEALSGRCHHGTGKDDSPRRCLCCPWRP
ncbi:hypothetical protein BLTE_07190 [Blastochloris tepida]|uniref:Uncharacterized protein n=1 Tax=Blastochloris tepida TaxID=2233851 RepID=A0A348FXK1_9HYPH|nr:hypothetical protein BLTE_07190 [Blastochloris tepida]